MADQRCRVGLAVLGQQVATPADEIRRPDGQAGGRRVAKAGQPGIALPAGVAQALEIGRKDDLVKRSGFIGGSVQPLEPNASGDRRVLADRRSPASTNRWRRSALHH